LIPDRTEEEALAKQLAEHQSPKSSGGKHPYDGLLDQASIHEASRRIGESD
jgi:hypothetical protein